MRHHGRARWCTLRRWASCRSPKSMSYLYFPHPCPRRSNSTSPCALLPRRRPRTRDGDCHRISGSQSSSGRSSPWRQAPMVLRLVRTTTPPQRPVPSASSAKAAPSGGAMHVLVVFPSTLNGGVWNSVGADVGANDAGSHSHQPTYSPVASTASHQKSPFHTDPSRVRGPQPYKVCQVCKSSS